MTELSRISNALDPRRAIVRAVIETPKGSDSKYSYNPGSMACELTTHLPAGMRFPFDFGFVPSTLAEDGDPLDILVLTDRPGKMATILDVKLLGIIEARQRERDGRTLRNDRLIGRAVSSAGYADVDCVSAMSSQSIEQLCRFFVEFNGLRGKAFTVLGVKGTSDAISAIIRSSQLYARAEAPHSDLILACQSQLA